MAIFAGEGSFGGCGCVDNGGGGEGGLAAGAGGQGRERFLKHLLSCAALPQVGAGEGWLELILQNSLSGWAISSTYSIHLNLCWSLGQEIHPDRGGPLIGWWVGTDWHQGLPAGLFLWLKEGTRRLGGGLGCLLILWPELLHVGAGGVGGVGPRLAGHGWWGAFVASHSLTPLLQDRKTLCNNLVYTPKYFLTITCTNVFMLWPFLHTIVPIYLYLYQLIVWFYTLRYFSITYICILPSFFASLNFSLRITERHRMFSFSVKFSSVVTGNHHSLIIQLPFTLDNLNMCSSGH